jgi:hypothetical protein
MYAIVNNNIISEWPIVNLPQRFPQISFANPINNNALPDGVVQVSVGAVPQYNPSIQKLVLGDPELVNGQWVQQYSIVDLTIVELEDRNTVQAEFIRTERNNRLKDSDWTQVADAPVNQSAWAEYRQALRDVTAQSGFPWTIEWPTQPE